MQALNQERIRRWLPWLAVPAALAFLVTASLTRPAPAAGGAEGLTGREQGPPGKTSYDQIAPVLLGQETFQARVAKDKAEKPSVMARQEKLLEERYDLTPRPDNQVRMSRGKPIQVGPAARLPNGMTWEKLAEMSPNEVR